MGGTINPLALAFNPGTFALSQTVTQPISLTVNPGLTANPSASRAPPIPVYPTPARRLRLCAVNAEPSLGGFAPPYKLFTDVTPSRSDRPDNYIIGGVSLRQPRSDRPRRHPQLFDPERRGAAAIENDRQYGRVYGQWRPQSGDQCRRRYLGGALPMHCNTITFNSIKVVTAALNRTAGSSLSLRSRPTRVLRAWSGVGTRRAGDAYDERPAARPERGGFPVTVTYCNGAASLTVYESDGANKRADRDATRHVCISRRPGGAHLYGGRAYD